MELPVSIMTRDNSHPPMSSRMTRVVVRFIEVGGLVYVEGDFVVGT